MLFLRMCFKTFKKVQISKLQAAVAKSKNVEKWNFIFHLSWPFKFSEWKKTEFNLITLHLLSSLNTV